MCEAFGIRFGRALADKDHRRAVGRPRVPIILPHPVFYRAADGAEAARQAYGARLAFDDWREMVASPEIDAVAVVVRVPSHYEPTKAALEAGKHVYCEWPLGRTTAEAEELARLAERKRLITAV